MDIIWKIMKNQLKRIVCLLLCLVMATSALMLSGCKKKSGEVLNLYTWAGMFPDELLRDFEKETGNSGVIEYEEYREMYKRCRSEYRNTKFIWKAFSMVAKKFVPVPKF